MRSVYFIGFVFALLGFVAALDDDGQYPIIVERPDEEVVATPDEECSLGDKEPVPPPIWNLCGKPSKHLLIPYILCQKD